MYKLFRLSLIILIALNIAVARSQDSSNIALAYENVALPISLIGVGLAISNSHFEVSVRDELQELVNKDFHTDADDLLIFAPVAEMYALDLLGVKSKNHWFDQSKNLFFSSLVSLSVTMGLKQIIDKTRPDGSTDDAFPSGHTTLAFAYATALGKEFGATSPYIAYSGYVVAGSVALLRLLNNRHWLSDVLVGAGIGIASTELIYMIEPLKSFNPFKEEENLSLIPIFNSTQYGICLAYRF
jgi:hypothetical protein